jgi:hypothetical protein
MDVPGYRGQRIFLPALAWLLGFGQPRLIIQVYALLNLAFFYALLAAVARRLPAVDARRFLVLYAIMLGSGTLVSVQYALTDLPAATLGFIALGQGEIAGSVFVSLAILTKPTAALFLAGKFAKRPRNVRAWALKLGACALALVLPALWQWRLVQLFGPHVIDASQFGWPLAGWWRHVALLGREAHAPVFPGNDNALIGYGAVALDLLALGSVLVQAVFVLARPRWRHPLWLVGASFAVLFLFMSEKNFGNSADYSRTLLPLGIAFFLTLLVIGNIGFAEGLGEMILVSCR